MAEHPKDNEEIPLRSLRFLPFKNQQSAIRNPQFLDSHPPLIYD